MAIDGCTDADDAIARIRAAYLRLGAGLKSPETKAPGDAEDHAARMADDAAYDRIGREVRADRVLAEAAGRHAAALYNAYKRLVVLQGLDSDACARLVSANADDREFVVLVTAHKRAVADLQAEERIAAERRAEDEAAYRAWKATERRAEARERWAARGRAVLGGAWWLVKAASVAGAVGYAGRLAWVDLAARYWG